MKELKQKLVGYRDLQYGIKMDRIFNVIPIDRERFEVLKGTLEYEHFDNFYMPRMYLQLTGRCNLRCRHCFAAVDNSPLTSELSPEEAEDIIRQARDCGICGMTLTGGEPTVYPHLIEFLKLMRKNDIWLLDFNTNGYNLKDEVLDTFRELDFDPNIKISLDGIGRHDEFRGVKGSEGRALEAMRRCKAAGFRVYSQTQVNRLTVDTLPALLDTVEDIGLTSIRLIKTTATPRWMQNAGGNDFSFYEYYKEVIKLIKYQLEKGHRTDLNIWECAYVTMPHTAGSSFTMVKGEKSCTSDSICPAFREMISVGADRKVYPCLEMQGIVNSLGYEYGSLREQSLREILNEGKYRDVLRYTAAERQSHNKECGECGYRDICTGGCPSLSLIYSGGDILGVDRSCCDFFRTGIYEEMKQLLKMR